MSPAPPDVTVVIPTHDRWDLLPRALASALGQEDVRVEVVVVDDGSRTPAPGDLALLRDPRVELVRHELARGVAGARNHGIARASAPWVAFLDDDDIWAPAKLRRQITSLERARARWGWSAALAVDAGLQPFRFDPAPPAEGIGAALLVNCWIAAPSAVVVETALLREVGGFDEDFSSTADWDLWIRLSALASGAAEAEPLLAYVEHGGNMLGGSADAEGARPEFDRLAIKHAAAAQQAGVEFGHVWWTGWVASRHRLAGRRASAAAAYLKGAIRHRSGGELIRAGGALLGEGPWHSVRRRIVGAPESPPWLDRLRG